jgi:hypothetical protein
MDRWQQIESLFAQAISLSASARTDFVLQQRNCLVGKGTIRDFDHTAFVICRLLSGGSVIDSIAAQRATRAD